MVGDLSDDDDDCMMVNDAYCDVMAISTHSGQTARLLTPHITHPNLPALGLGRDLRLMHRFGLCARDFPLPSASSISPGPPLKSRAELEECVLYMRCFQESKITQ
jgi:hypothetical protein